MCEPDFIVRVRLEFVNPAQRAIRIANIIIVPRLGASVAVDRPRLKPALVNARLASLVTHIGAWDLIPPVADILAATEPADALRLVSSLRPDEYFHSILIKTSSFS